MTLAVDAEQFAARLLDWFDRHGRKDLPWQQQVTPYRVWVSEVMLQQTQVVTVVPYYQRFIDRFPTVEALAQADLDEVLSLWSGLGYYARARNLHAAAGRIHNDLDGCFPEQIDQLMALPGIGRSTAGAILSLACGQSHAILDGNVKRVLSRYYMLEGWPGKAAVQKRLWQLAETLTPSQRAAAYNQAMMDLGATCCVRRNPTCGACPLQAGCAAHALGRPHDYPASKPSKAIPVRSVQLLMICNPHGEVLLEKRPPNGIWGGLWSLPELALNEDVGNWCLTTLGLEVGRQEQWESRRHTFSHFRLDMLPVLIHTKSDGSGIMEGNRRVWYNPDQQTGLAAPVARLIEEFKRRVS